MIKTDELVAKARRALASFVSTSEGENEHTAMLFKAYALMRSISRLNRTRSRILLEFPCFSLFMRRRLKPWYDIRKKRLTGQTFFSAGFLWIAFMVDWMGEPCPNPNLNASTGSFEPLAAALEPASQGSA